MRGMLLGLLLAGAAVAADPPAAKPLTDEQKAKLKERDAAAEQADALRAKGDLAGAVRATERALAVERAVFGETGDDVAGSWELLAELHEQAGDLAAAAVAARARLAATAAGRPADQWQVADARRAVADLQARAGMSAADRDRLREAAVLRAKGMALYYEQGRPAEAEAVCRTVLDLRTRVLGAAHPDTAQAMNSQGLMLSELGYYDRAEPLLLAALQSRERALGTAHPAVAQSLTNVSLLYQNQGLYDRSESYALRSLEAFTRAVGRDHPDTANCANVLACLYFRLGQVERAEPLFLRSLAVRENTLGPDHLDIADCLSNLGALYRGQGRTAEAERVLRRALGIVRTGRPADHLSAATPLNNLAGVYDELGRPTEAELLLRESLGIHEKWQGPDHPDTVESLNSLAGFLATHGRPADAEPLARRALAVRERVFGGDHPVAAESQATLAEVLLARDRPAEAEPLARRAVGTTAAFLDRSATAMSEGGQLAHAASKRDQLTTLLRATAGAADCYREVLRWRGAVTARQTFARATRGVDAESQKLLADLTAVTRQLATLANNPPPPEKKIDIPARMKELTEKRNDLEAKLAGRSATFDKYVKNRGLAPADLQKSLPAGTALVDFVEYGGRLAAFVVRKDGIARVELGDAKPVAAAADGFLATMNRVHAITGKPDDPAAVLRKLVWEPVSKHLGDATTVLVCPDGPLCRVPFAALPGADPNKYLIEEVALAVVPVPRLLPDLLADRGPKKDEPPTLLAVGDVDFDGTPATQVAAAEPAGWKRKRAGEAGNWKRLPGTAGELTELGDAFKRAVPAGKLTVLREKGATEAAVRDQLGRHEFVHLATHGFFAPPTKTETDTRSAVGDLPRPAGPHPGLMSGLALAGANKPQGDDDGVLTALEVGDLDLSRVELAVLSACETGLGAVAGGEGVLGLQRAFQVAGARTTVTSLWKVDDDATRTLMGRFYQGFWTDNKGSLEALRAAQLDMLAKGPGRGLDREPAPADGRPGRTPPRLWAAFVLAGDWR